MTVLDHMKAAGYDPNAARNADDLRRMGGWYDGMREHPAPHVPLPPLPVRGRDVGRRGHRNGSLYGWYAAALPGRMAEQHQGKRNGFFQD